MNRIAGWVSCVACAIAGCSAPATPAVVDAAPAVDRPPERLVLGTTTIDRQGFLPLQGDQVLVQGSQGGFHVWLKIRVAGLVPQVVTLRRAAHRVADGESLFDLETMVQIGNSVDGYWEQPSPLPMFLCPTRAGVTIVDQAIRLEVGLLSSVTLDDLGDATTEFTTHCPDDARAACLQLCAR